MANSLARRSDSVRVVLDQRGVLVAALPPEMGHSGCPFYILASIDGYCIYLATQAEHIELRPSTRQTNYRSASCCLSPALQFVLLKLVVTSPRIAGHVGRRLQQPTRFVTFRAGPLLGQRPIGIAIRSVPSSTKSPLSSHRHRSALPAKFATPRHHHTRPQAGSGDTAHPAGSLSLPQTL